MKKQLVFKLKKKTLFDYIKILSLLGVILIFTFAFQIDYNMLFRVSFVIIAMFLSVTFAYFLDANSDERNVLINIWKLYISVITVMIILMFTMSDNANKIQLEYDKTKLLYDIRTNSDDINKSFLAYEKTVKRMQKQYEKKDINNTKLNEESNKEEEKKAYLNLYMNFTSMVIIIMTIFSSIWLLIEREEIKKSQEGKTYLEKYKKIVADRKKYMRK